jgi:hypothetical protein
VRPAGVVGGATVSTVASERIREALREEQAGLVSDLASARARFSQGTDRGTAGAEAPFRDFLTRHIARRLAVGQGEIIDTFGRESGQTDVVIVEDDHPFAVEPDSPALILIEGVTAAGEVKSSLTSGELDNAFNKSAAFKALEPIEANGSEVRTNPEDERRFLARRPYFLLAFESQLTLDRLAAKITEAVAEHPDTGIFDAVFCLDRGWIINFGNGEGAFKFIVDGHSVPGWVRRDIPEGEILFDFLVWLSAVMPRIVRFESPYSLYF